ncbi:hypothetical protein G7Y89_g1318 [Cudoniella acicularis]|uniref:Uncharacterized protein n=1 Tax=Cudoniella acicularis TaxID=354080 RepID=A0A8H4W9N0_9HELO|nr:hypothetical protein G7Y89_g1318 [Cudoniella acicularis]
MVSSALFRPHSASPNTLAPMTSHIHTPRIEKHVVSGIVAYASMVTISGLAQDPSSRLASFLRIRDESEDVRKKALSQSLLRASNRQGPISLPLSLELQARHAFFAHYVTGKTKPWGFLTKYYNPVDSPEHLKSSLDAVSLAYLSSQVNYPAAITAGRQKYVSALQMTTKALKDLETAKKDSTLLTSLLLDLFEKITNDELRNGNAWTNHVNGALALVKLRGLDKFQGDIALRVLVRLSTNLLISCVASGSPVPVGLSTLRAYAGKQLNAADPKWHLTDLMIVYANLRNEILRQSISVEKYIELSIELDLRLQALTTDMSPFWQNKTTVVNHKSERIYDNHFDSYADRHVTQTWNVMRLVIMVDRPENSHQQWMGIVRDGFDHKHTPSHKWDCYTLIYPLYVAGKSKGSPDDVKPWVIKQLQYMSSHFGIRMADVVCRILQSGADLNPWEVYAMLGSYAFAA